MMMRIRWSARRLAAAMGVVGALAVASPSGASVHARGGHRDVADALVWRDCGDGFQCATARVPRNYSKPARGTFALAVIRRPAADQAERIGSIFFNPGGPGGSGVQFVREIATGTFSKLNRQFDLVGFDPRGVGASTPAVRCLTDAEARTQFSLPLPRPATLDVAALTGWASGWVARCRLRNPGILPDVTTGNTARDLNRLRAAVGDPTLNYVGYSYGTVLGATYATLFPHRVRALVLDGAVDPDVWMKRPLQATREQVAGYERALQRFFVYCARTVCSRLLGSDPEEAFDQLASSLDRHPLRARPPYDPTPVTGDTLRVAAADAMTYKEWLVFVGALVQAMSGDGTQLRLFADRYWGIDDRGAYDGGWDRNLAISALDQLMPRGVEPYLDAGRDNFALFPRFWWASGYFDLPVGLYSVRPRGVFRGPFTVAPDAPTALVVGTKYDPATPYVWAQRLTGELGNARLLTLIGDGHTSVSDPSTCVEQAVATYLETLTLPAEGAQCRPDSAGAPTVAAIAAAARRRTLPHTPSIRPAVPR
jgi:pimeloyl-ACP methyl ester carboxylesterase